MLASSLNIKEEVSFNDNLLTMPVQSARMIGIVDVDEYDAYGRKVFSTRNKNDITLPGSIYMLEQMFKVEANERFLHPTTGFRYSYTTDDTFSAESGDIIKADIDLGSQKVFGFMVGIGGTDSGSNVIAPDYNIQTLSKFVPFRIVSSTEGINEVNKQYSFSFNKGNSRYYYVKKFDNDESGTSTDTFITAQWSDGSGTVDSSELSLGTNTPIVAYAQCQLIVDAQDVREYFGDMKLDECSINQLGLVAGQPVTMKDSNGKEYTDYADIKLISCVNFKARDLSNTENTLKITYKIYCL